MTATATATGAILALDPGKYKSVACAYDPGNVSQKDRERLLPLLRPYPAGEMVAEPVGRYVSNPRNEGPQCLAS